MKLALTLLLALSLSSCRYAQFLKIQKAMQAETMKQYAFKREMPFEYISGFIVIEATIGDKTGKFILDTGALTLLDDDFVKNVLFKTLGKQKHKDVNGNKKYLKTVKLDKLSISGIDFQGIVATVSDLEILKILKTNRCIDASGILGVNVMNKGVWQIDYFNKKITITDSKDSLNLPADKKVISFYATGKGTPQIRVTANGVYLGEAELDTGNNGDFDMQKKTINNLPFAKTAITKRGLSGGAFGLQEDTTLITMLPTLTLGENFEIQNTVVSLSSSLSGNPLIGYQFLKNYVVTIDWKYNEITLIPSNLSLEKPFLTYGFSPIFKDGKLYVASIIEQSSADKAGLRLNDQIIQINGKDYNPITQIDYCDFLQQDLLKKSNTLQLVVKRGDKEIKHELIKTDMMDILMKN